MLATDLPVSSSFYSGHSAMVWEDSKSLKTIMESSLPRVRSPATSSFELSIPPHSSQIQSAKSHAKYLFDQANVEILWTTHLPDHLDLQGKKLRISELASYLELSRTLVDDSHSDFAVSLER